MKISIPFILYLASLGFDFAPAGATTTTITKVTKKHTSKKHTSKKHSIASSPTTEPSSAPTTFDERLQNMKPEVCYRPSGSAFSITAEEEEETNGLASLEFGIVRVSDGESLLVDLMVQSMRMMTYYEMGYGRKLEHEDIENYDGYVEVEANAFLHKGCSALPCEGGTTTESVFPGGLVMASVGSYTSYEGHDHNEEISLMEGDVDMENEISYENGVMFKSTNTGKFLFPGLDEGSYLLQVTFDLTAAVRIFGLIETVEINEHLVTVTRTANEGECDWDDSRSDD